MSARKVSLLVVVLLAVPFLFGFQGFKKIPRQLWSYLNGSDGNGARIEMDINATAMTCGSTATGTQMCMEFRDDGVSPNGMVWVQKEGETARLVGIQTVSMVVWLTNVNNVVQCIWPQDDYHTTLRNCPQANDQQWLEQDPTPDGYDRYIIDVQAMPNHPLSVNTNDCTFYFGQDLGAWTADTPVCTDVTTGCTDWELTPMFHFGQRDSMGDGSNLDDRGEWGTFDMNFKQVVAYWAIIADTKHECSGAGEPCAVDADCGGVETCVDMTGTVECTHIQGVNFVVHYIDIPQ